MFSPRDIVSLLDRIASPPVILLLLHRADIDKRKAEMKRLEEEGKKHEMEKLRKDMESSQGETVVLNTGLKDRDATEKMMLEEEDEDFQVEDEEDSDDAIGDMLVRMYMRWGEKQRYKKKVVEMSAGEEAGIKSATLEIEGRYAYGYLSGEKELIVA